MKSEHYVYSTSVPSDCTPAFIYTTSQLRHITTSPANAHVQHTTTPTLILSSSLNFFPPLAFSISLILLLSLPLFSSSALALYPPHPPLIPHLPPTPSLANTSLNFSTIFSDSNIFSSSSIVPSSCSMMQFVSRISGISERATVLTFQR